MRSKIYFPEQGSETFKEVYSSFIISQTSKGLAAVTIRNYHLHLRSISKHLDIGMPFCSLTKRHLESMVVSMRAAGLAHNTVATYLRVINTFLNWANREGLTSVSIPNIKEKDTVKETYTDAELLILLKKPEKKCDFCEYRNWGIINYAALTGSMTKSAQYFSFQKIHSGHSKPYTVRSSLYTDSSNPQNGECHRYER